MLLREVGSFLRLAALLIARPKKEMQLSPVDGYVSEVARLEHRMRRKLEEHSYPLPAEIHKAPQEDASGNQPKAKKLKVAEATPAASSTLIAVDWSG